MNPKLKMLLGVLAVLLAIQMIQPDWNENATITVSDISNLYPIPADVQIILRQACYDCHSNQTKYPWYSHVQPIGWWLQHHVDEGKASLNFSEFGTYQEEDHPIIFKELDDVIRWRSMPLDSYVLMHKKAELTDAQFEKLKSWVSDLRQSVAKNR